MIGSREAAETAHAPIPWNMVRRNVSVWLLSTIMICASFNSYIYFSWFPKYLQAGRGVTAGEAGWMASLVLLFSACGTYFGGWILDRLNICRSVVRRRLFGGGAFVLAAIMLACALLSTDPWQAATCAALSCFCTQATQPLWWICAIGISGRHVGALTGLMNSCGVIGAMGSQYLVGRIADWLGTLGLNGRAQWDPIFYIDLAVLAIAAVLWLMFRLDPVEVD